MGINSLWTPTVHSQNDGKLTIFTPFLMVLVAKQLLNHGLDSLGEHFHLIQIFDYPKFPLCNLNEPKKLSPHLSLFNTTWLFRVGFVLESQRTFEAMTLAIFHNTLTFSYFSFLYPISYMCVFYCAHTFCICTSSLYCLANEKKNGHLATRIQIIFTFFMVILFYISHFIGCCCTSMDFRIEINLNLSKRILENL